MGHDEWGMDEESIGNRFWFRIIYFLRNELDVERWKQRRTPGAADHDGDEPETKGGAQETNRQIDEMKSGPSAKAIRRQPSNSTGMPVKGCARIYIP